MNWSRRTLVLQLSALAILGLSCPALADTSDWKSLYEAGVEADDAADYKTAITTLSQSCELAVAETGSGPQAKACLKLALVHAIDGNLKKARTTCESLLARLRDLSSSDPGDIVDVLIMLANVHSAEGSKLSALDAMQQALPHLEKLAPIARARMLFRMAEFYLPFEGKTTGDKLLRNAKLNLLSAVDYRDPAYVEAATDFAWVLLSADRRADTEGIQARLLEEGKKLFAGGAAPDLALGEAYIQAARHTLFHRNESAEEDAAGSDPGKLANEWSVKLKGKAEVHRFVKGEVGPPVLLSKKDPSYTNGAREAGVEGLTVLLVEVWPDGRAHNVQALRRLPYGLSWAAIGAVRKWRFAPGRVNGTPVKVAASVEVNFRLR